MTQCVSWPSGFNSTCCFLTHNFAILLWILQFPSLTWLGIMPFFNLIFVSNSGVTASQSLSTDILYLRAAESMMAQTVKNLPAMWETRVWSLDQEDPLEKGMATHSNILAWRILWKEEPSGLCSMGLPRVRHDWMTNIHLEQPSPTFLAPVTGFVEDNFSTDLGMRGQFHNNSSALHLLCTIFLLLLHQLHLISSGVRFQRLRIPDLKG